MYVRSEMGEFARLFNELVDGMAKSVSDFINKQK